MVPRAIGLGVIQITFAGQHLARDGAAGRRR